MVATTAGPTKECPSKTAAELFEVLAELSNANLSAVERLYDSLHNAEAMKPALGSNNSYSPTSVQSVVEDIASTIHHSTERIVSLTNIINQQYSNISVLP